MRTFEQFWHLARFIRYSFSTMSHFNRRNFLARSASGLGVYSLIIHTEDGFSQAESGGTTQQISRTSMDPHKANSQSLYEPHMTVVDLDCDFLVAGGGLAGICAAVSAARNGSRVILIQDRSRLGGNSSSEVRMHVVGADNHNSRPGWREGGLIEEFRLEDAVKNPHRAWELWDLMLYDKCIKENNLTLLLDTALYSTRVVNGQIKNVLARCDKTEHIYRIAAPFFSDCTGDSRLALEAGAEFRMGRESRDEFGETLAPGTADRRTQGSSILFTAREHAHPMPYNAPSWARKIRKEQLEFRPVGSWEYGYWWIELGGMYDTIKDNERLRFELLSVVLGVWDYIKNSGNHPESSNWALQTVGMIPGKRESRRVLGDVIQTQEMLEGGWKSRNDGVAIGGWNLDDHPPEGFDAPDLKPFTSIPVPEPYNIALEALYSRNVPNLMIAGRNISNSHVAFSSTRVMATCAAIGQAVGTTATYCLEKNKLPRDVARDPLHIAELQQRLLNDDQTIRGIRNNHPNDHALKADISASSFYADGRPENIITGKTRDLGDSNQNKWVAQMPGDVSLQRPVWIELNWDQAQPIDLIQITFDSGFHRELTLSAAKHVNQRVIRGPQPETVRDYQIVVHETDGKKTVVADVKGNYQRLRKHRLNRLQAKSVRLNILATNGIGFAHVFEIRCLGGS